MGGWGSIVCAQFSPKSVDTHTTSVDQTAIYSTDTVLVPGVGGGGGGGCGPENTQYYCIWCVPFALQGSTLPCGPLGSTLTRGPGKKAKKNSIVYTELLLVPSSSPRSLRPRPFIATACVL